MKFKFSKEICFQLFFTFCVIIPFFNNYEFSFLCWFLATMITLKRSYSILFLRYLSYFILIFLSSIVVSFFFNNKLYFIIRDMTYLLKPILGLLLGYQFYRDKLIKNPFTFLLNAGIVMAAIHLIMVGYGVLLQGATSVAKIREYGGYFNDFEVYTLIILLFYKKFEIDLSKRKFYFYLTILALSSFFYLARTNFIQFFILFFAMKGWLIINKKSLTILTSLALFSIIAYTAIYQYNPKRNGDGVDEFLYKVKLIPLEAFATKINRSDWKDFHDHYRSYENIRTIEQLSYNNTFLFGEGMGSQVNLKQKVFLGDMFLKYISILHNGYMTVLLKSGLLGLLLLIGSILFFFKTFNSQSEIEKNINLLFLGTGVFLLISYWVFMGFYNLLDSKTLLIGFLFAYKNKLNQLN
jgi:hypothetical protein